MNDFSSAAVEFSKDFSGRVLLPTDPTWGDARRVHNGLVDRRPAVIAQCLGSADIVRAVRFARDRSLEIAVRGGGHNVGGSATVDSFDLISAITDWVEKGKAPDAVVAKSRTTPSRTRPLCAYPAHAQYNGTGDPQDAKSFTCSQ